MSHQSFFQFPSGKTRLEPAGILLVAMAMGIVGLQMIIKATETIVAGAEGELPQLNMSAVYIVVLTIYVLQYTSSSF